MATLRFAPPHSRTRVNSQTVPLETDRQRLLRPKANRVVQLLVVLDAADLEHADADAVAGDAEPDSLAGQLVRPEEPLQRLGQRLGVPQLSADDDAGLQGLARDL